MPEVTGNGMDDIHVGYWLGHLFSTGAILGTLWGVFPVIAAMVAFIWYCIQIYESSPVQNWLHQRRKRALKRLERRVKCLQEQIRDADAGDDK